MPSAIPTVDLSPFFTGGDESGRKKAKDTIAEACSDYGFFQIVNHGVPLDLMNQAMELSKTFFNNSDKVKHHFQPATTSSRTTPDKNEYLLMFLPESPFNVLPDNPPDFRKKLEEIFKYFVKTGEILEGIISDCLGLPPNFFKEYNGWDDFMVTMRYLPGTETDNRDWKGGLSTGGFITRIIRL